MEEKPSIFVFQQTGGIFRGIVIGSREAPLTIVGNLCTKKLTVIGSQYGGIRLIEMRDGDAQKGNEKARKNKEGDF